MALGRATRIHPAPAMVAREGGGGNEASVRLHGNQAGPRGYAGGILRSSRPSS